MELEERFWSKASWTLDGWGTRESPCWGWLAGKNHDGYGKFGLYGDSLFAHRIAYELERSEIPDDLELDHLCRNKGCVNPWHLESVTHVENMKRTSGYIMTAERKSRISASRMGQNNNPRGFNGN